MIREIEVECPSCSPKKEVPHEVLKMGQSPVVRCQVCGQVHAAKIEVPKPVNVRVIVSRRDLFSHLQNRTRPRDRPLCG